MAHVIPDPPICKEDLIALLHAPQYVSGVVWDSHNGNIGARYYRPDGVLDWATVGANGYHHFIVRFDYPGWDGYKPQDAWEHYLIDGGYSIIASRREPPTS